MAYTFTHNGDVLCSTMESFWLYCSFDIEDETNFVTVQDGYLAVYFSQQNEEPAIARPSRERGIACEISRESHRVINLRNLSLIASRMAEFGNERSYLHLYRFDNNKLPDWIDIGWSSNYRNPDHNDDYTPLLDRKVSFDNVVDRHVYWMSIEESFRGIQTLSLATPFMGKSIFADIIQAHNKEIPTLRLKSDWHGTEWEFPNKAEDVADSTQQGFVMVSEGAFASMPLSAELDSSVAEDSWFFGRAAGAAPILKRLSTLVYDYPTEYLDGGLRRYLFQARNTSASSVIPTTRDNPFEVLHIRGMNDERMSSVISDRR